VRLPVVILIGIAALVMGIGFGLAIAPSPSPLSVEAPTPNAAAASFDELARWKEEILAEVRALRETHQSGEASASQRLSAVTAQTDVDQRLSAIEQRLDALALGAPAYQRTPAWRNARGRGFPSIDAAEASLRDADQHGRLAEAREELGRRFYLWTPEEVIAAFGPPTSVGAQHGVDFSYGNFELSNGTCTLWFSFQAGLISEVWFDCHDRK
jgi:hypothetical protein